MATPARFTGRSVSRMPVAKSPGEPLSYPVDSSNEAIGMLLALTNRPRV
jgi:hypothetical protein